MRTRRSLLYMPGTDWGKIDKAATSLDVDAVCMDLEDGVAPNRKVEAREVIVKALENLDFGRSERLVRVNSMDSGLIEDDLAAVLPARPDGIVIPKVRSDGHLKWISDQIASVEGIQGWRTGGIALLAIIETAKGVIGLPEICAATPRLTTLIFGAEDLAGDIGATRTRSGAEVFHARSEVVLYATAFDLQPIDMVFVNFRDQEGLLKEAEYGARMGFEGKQLIHPNQIAPIHEAFTPSDDAIKRAQRIVQAYEDHAQEGRGAFALEGQMIDMPAVKSAKRVLERAKSAGKINAVDQGPSANDE